ncbi:Clock-controlled protein [Paramyrothecium foliicola]|nr:Clock-controlled protein [Paramyrothecium foliicola]
MKFAAIAALAVTGVSAYAHGNVTVVTEVVSSYVTYCPEPTQITHGDKTYTVTEATTLTITDCPCTITKPIITTSHVECVTCVPHVPTSVPAPPPPHNNATIPAPPPPATNVPVPSSSVVPPPPATTPPASGAGKAMAISGAGLAGVMALAAFL